MKDFPNKNMVLDAVVTGIQTAKKNYTFWTSDELYLSYAPQNFIKIHIAQEIAKLDEAPEIFIDASIADVLRCSLPDRNSFRNYMYEKQLSQDSIDITLDERFTHINDNDSISRVIINVENGIRNVKQEYKDRVSTICKMLDKNDKSDSSLDYGVFAFYLDISNTARKKAQTRISEIVDAFTEIVDEYKNLKSNFIGGEINTVQNIGEWCIGCFVIESSIEN